MSADEIINCILSTRIDTSREEILRRIKEKRSAAGGFLEDETAARLVASEFGVTFAPRLFHAREIPIDKLVLGLNDVTVMGRVLVAYPAQKYVRKNGTMGQFGHLLIADDTGTIRVLLWNDKAGIMEEGKIKQAQIVRIIHGYVREANDGQLELHLSQRSELDVDPQGVKDDRFPKIESLMEKIGKITKKKKKVSIIGTVLSVSSITGFQRADKSEGKVCRATLKDCTGQIVVVFWNDKVAVLEDVQIGDRLQVIDARVKEGIDGQLELHVEKRAFVEKLAPIKDEVAKISSLQKEGILVSIEGVIRTAPVEREVTTSRGEKIKVASFELEDSSGKIWVSAWRKHAEIVGQFVAGSKIRIRDAYVRKGFGDSLEISTRAASTVEVLSD
ncbi:MAG TPA: OB-fold nucleic acid binding domain-containing protein [Candidatus Bathyarchaeia archaeon]|nr:OB-fold nucleic acid binding domain-containing protein [Candidatus Bathyarchaeia archaeon]